MYKDTENDWVWIKIDRNNTWSNWVCSGQTGQTDLGDQSDRSPPEQSQWLQRPILSSYMVKDDHMCVQISPGSDDPKWGWIVRVYLVRLKCRMIQVGPDHPGLSREFLPTKIENNVWKNPRTRCVNYFTRIHDLGFHWAGRSDRSGRLVMPVQP